MLFLNSPKVFPYSRMTNFIARIPPRSKWAFDFGRRNCSKNRTMNTLNSLCISTKWGYEAERENWYEKLILLIRLSFTLPPPPSPSGTLLLRCCACIFYWTCLWRRFEGFLGSNECIDKTPFFSCDAIHSLSSILRKSTFSIKKVDTSCRIKRAFE